MLLMYVLLVLVAFAEVSFFFYLKRSELKTLKLLMAARSTSTKAEVLFLEADHANKEATSRYKEATWLVGQAKAGYPTPR